MPTLSEQYDTGSSVGHVDDDDDDLSSEGTNDEQGPTTSGPMMSIFASYYGIVDPANCEQEQAKGTIDDSNFDVTEYVKVKASVFRKIIDVLSS